MILTYGNKQHEKELEELEVTALARGSHEGTSRTRSCWFFFPVNYVELFDFLKLCACVTLK